MTLPAAPTTAARPVAQTPLHLSERDGKRRGGARPAAARGLTAGEWTAACWRSLLGSVCGERGAARPVARLQNTLGCDSGGHKAGQSVSKAPVLWQFTTTSSMPDLTAQLGLACWGWSWGLHIAQPCQ